MGARVTITIEGLDQAITRLTEIKEKGEENLIKQVKKLSDDGRDAWKDATPRRKGRLQEEEEGVAAGLSIAFKSPTYYYDWVNEGHDTPRGWHRLTKHGVVWRAAKHRSHVAGREMTPKLMEWLTDNTEEYLAKFLDGV